MSGSFLILSADVNGFQITGVRNCQSVFSRLKVNLENRYLRNQPESVPYDRSVRRLVTFVIWYEYASSIQAFESE